MTYLLILIIFFTLVLPAWALYKFLHPKCPKCKTKLRFTGYGLLYKCDECDWEGEV